ncbi:MAG: hypothetical protein DRP50_00820 [Thermotoga sp.]|nr:MAG: hypothetical protein DRP50_00820 [Thermotoga sp.]
MKPHRNSGLFSNYYLDELLPKEKEFDIPSSEVKDIFVQVKGLWNKDRFQSLNESQLRMHFLDKVLNILGWIVDVEPPTPSGEWSKQVDYALFKNEKALNDAQKGGRDEYFKEVACIGEAKRWERSLDKKLKSESDPFEKQIPSLQISRYLWLTNVKWGILTNGRYWRVYERETSKRLDIFYEIDLEELVENRSVDNFKYFYLFFRKDAFPDFVEKVYTGSINYAKAVGKELKENVYKALEYLAEGFLEMNDLGENDLKEVYDNCLILLYRLLFILYAEYRNLLPVRENSAYYSMEAIKKDIAKRLDENEIIPTSTHRYWDRLKELFELVNSGNEELEVPPYNGGLFNPEKHKFLERYRIGDLYIAKAIDLLTRSRSKDKAYIDYGSLDIRHLGSIYEGLLEHKLQITDEEPAKVYLAADKGERKVTGSYYTPDYIVKYIVENTLGPLIKEKRRKIIDRKKGIEEKYKKARGYNREFYERKSRNVEEDFVDEILSIKVLDPAMGSGHFLVEATDYLAHELLRVLGGEPLEEENRKMLSKESPISYGNEPEELEEDIRWARREVVERCIFGVDLNPLAVELAKVSLWLYTASKNYPLNFLDHHLRCGNSLIGARIENLKNLPDLRKKRQKLATNPNQIGLFEKSFEEKVNVLVGAFAQIEGIPSKTVEQIKEKEQFYEKFRNIISRFKDVADIWTSIYFGNEIDIVKYQQLQNNLRTSTEEWNKLKQEPYFRKAQEIAEEKRFFHWELEFPEIFFEDHRRKENPGFDAVIGNPPYIGFHGFKETKEYLRFTFVTCKGKFDMYIPFWEQALFMVGKDKTVTFICPSGFMKRAYGKRLRNVLLSYELVSLHDFQHDLVFEKATNYTCILQVRKVMPKSNHKLRITLGHDLSSEAVELVQSHLAKNNWLISEKYLNFERIISSPNIVRLESIAEFIAEGIVTGKNEVFLIDASTEFGKQLITEPIVWPALRGKAVDRYESCWDGTLLIYPYAKQTDRQILHLNETAFEKIAPKSYKYLNKHRNNLARRSYFEDSNKNWFELWNQRNVNHQISNKLVVQENSVRCEFYLDNGNYLYLDTSCGISLPSNSNLTYTYLLAILNSRLLDLIFQVITVPKLNGHFIHKPLYLKQLPIRRIAFTTSKEEREKLVMKFKEMYRKFIGEEVENGK